MVEGCRPSYVTIHQCLVSTSKFTMVIKSALSVQNTDTTHVRDSAFVVNHLSTTCAPMCHL